MTTVWCRIKDGLYGRCQEMCDMSMKLRLNCLTPPTVPWFLINEPPGLGDIHANLFTKPRTLSEGDTQSSNHRAVFLSRDMLVANEVPGWLRGQRVDGGGR